MMVIPLLSGKFKSSLVAEDQKCTEQNNLELPEKILDNLISIFSFWDSELLSVAW